MEAWQREGGGDLLAGPGFRELLDSACSGNSTGSGQASPSSLRHFRNFAIKLHDRHMRGSDSNLPPSCQHILMFAALLTHDSLAVAAVACAAMAACLQHGSEAAGGVQTAQPELLLQLAPRLGPALCRLILAEEGTPPTFTAAMNVAMHLGLATAAAPSELEGDGKAATMAAALRALAPVAVDFARFAASQAEASMAAAATAEAAVAAAVPAGAVGLAAAPSAAAAAAAAHKFTDMRLLSAALLVRGASFVAPQNYPPLEVLSSALALLQCQATMLRQLSRHRRGAFEFDGGGSGSIGGGGDAQLALELEIAQGQMDKLPFGLQIALHAAARSATVVTCGGQRHDQTAAAQHSRADSPTGRLPPEVAAEALRAVGHLCAAAVATGSNSPLAEALRETGHLQVLLRAGLASARAISQWRLVRCLAHLTRPEPLAAMSHAAASHIAATLAHTAATLHHAVPPAAFGAAEALAARAELLAAPALLLQRSVSVLRAARSTVEASVMDAAVAAMQATSAAVLQAIGRHQPGNPSLLYGGGGDGSGRRDSCASGGNSSSGISRWFPASGATATAFAGADCSSSGSRAGQHPSAAGPHCSGRSQGATSVALTDSGALAALAAVFALSEGVEAALTRAWVAWAKPLQGGDDLVTERSDGGGEAGSQMTTDSEGADPLAGHASAYNALVAAAGLLEAEVAAGWAPPAAVVTAHVQAVGAALEWVRTQFGHSKPRPDAAWRSAATICDILTGLASAPATGEATATAVSARCNLGLELNTDMLLLVVFKRVNSSEDTALLGQMLWLLAAAAARNQLLRQLLLAAGDRGWRKTKTVLRSIPSKSRLQTQMQWVDAALQGTPPPLQGGSLKAATEAQAAQADAAMQALLQEEGGVHGAAAAPPASGAASANTGQSQPVAVRKAATTATAATAAGGEANGGAAQSTANAVDPAGSMQAAEAAGATAAAKAADQSKAAKKRARKKAAAAALAEAAAGGHI